MNFIHNCFVLYLLFINSYTFSKTIPKKDQILSDLNDTVKKARGTIKEFEELYKLTKSEVVKFKDVIKDLPNNNYTHERFIQVAEPANEGKIRESLYVTQLKRSTPQSKISIDVKENVDDIVNNTSELASFTDESDGDYFEDELHRMEMEEISRSRVKSIEDQLRSMNNEIQWLITPKQSIKVHTSGENKPESELSQILIIINNYKKLLINILILDLRIPLLKLFVRIRMPPNLIIYYNQYPSCHDRDPSTKLLDNYPPDRTELGNAGWLFLHTIATQYPDNPDEDTKLRYLGFLHSFARLYPCSICREGLVPIYKEIPPNVESRKSFLLWTSKLHNYVNKDTGKPEENYTYEQLLEKYSS
ncbi:hypothetical protein MACK_001604 [Theileria orientalis]|uniref:Sulfhydryl oxidase n=1 Tax=Theileria orientalis TaxID=68886 RepID=A0A976QVF6_THEOR|nr:hypothetical protein MACK_001604 [Theileria orientalis]